MSSPHGLKLLLSASQKEQLANLAKVIASDYVDLTESFAVGRICLVTGRTWDKALTGLKIIESEKFLPKSFIKSDSRGVLERFCDKNPAIRELFDRFDVVPLTTTVGDYRGLCLQKRPSARELAAELAKRVSLPEF